MGNRGVIHNERKQIVRPFRHNAWITCVLEFKERKRVVMAPGKWTELFFLDEATAFAAGHRPCFECRREAAMHFKECWIKGNPEYGFNMKTLIGEIDEVLQRERIGEHNEKIVFQCEWELLFDGTFVEVGGEAYLYNEGTLHRWTPFRYEERISVQGDKATVLTPRSIVNAFRSGYKVSVRM